MYPCNSQTSRAFPLPQKVPSCPFPVSLHPSPQKPQGHPEFWLLSPQINFTCSGISQKWNLTDVLLYVWIFLLSTVFLRCIHVIRSSQPYPLVVGTAAVLQVRKRRLRQYQNWGQGHSASASPHWDGIQVLKFNHLYRIIADTWTLFQCVSSRVLLLEVWSVDPQHCRHPGAGRKWS